MMNLNQKHFDEFLTHLEQPVIQGAIGRSPRRWFKTVSRQDNDNLEENPICRNKLKAICLNDKISNHDCVISVMSWGGQRTDHARMMLGHNRRQKPIQGIESIVEQMRSGHINRKQAYSEFMKLRLDNKLKGVGIAYFTKLIYFCDPKHDGYILDQWLARSVNLLSADPFISITKYGYVTDENDADVYEQYCCFIDNIAQQSGKTADQIETAMFSNGGRNKGEWRCYVINN